MKVYNIFLLNKLRKVVDNPLLGQVNKPLLLIIIEEEQE